MSYAPEALFVLGAVGIVIGVALWSVPLAWIVGGVLCGTLGVLAAKARSSARA